MDTENDLPEEEISHRPPDVVDEPEVDQDEAPAPEKRRRGPYRSSRLLQEKLEHALSEIEELKKGHRVVYGAEQNHQLATFEGNYRNSAQHLANAINERDAVKIVQAQEGFNRAQYELMQVRQEAQKQPPPAPTRPKTSRATQRWLEQNDWLYDPEFEDEAALAHRIDQRLSNEWAEEGFTDEIGSKDYIAELDDRLAKNKKLSNVPLSNRNQPPVGRGRTVAGAGRPSGTMPKARLKPELIEAARMMGKPVDDPAFLKRLEGFIGAKK